MTVNISGTFSEKQRPNNGLETVAEHLNQNRLTRVAFVGYAEWHAHSETTTGEKTAVVIAAIEPGMRPDGTDPDGYDARIFELLDQLRRRRGKGAVADTLFSVPASVIHGGPDPDDELPGQMELTRVGPDGEHVVPPPSGEEITAERDEAKAAGQRRSPSAATVAAVTGVPVPAFTSPDGA
jgi:hypothetical protein